MLCLRMCVCLCTKHLAWKNVFVCITGDDVCLGCLGVMMVLRKLRLNKFKTHASTRTMCLHKYACRYIFHSVWIICVIIGLSTHSFCVSVMGRDGYNLKLTFHCFKRCRWCWVLLHNVITRFQLRCLAESRRAGKDN